MKKRCEWVREGTFCWDYHDKEWGVPVHEDTQLFEFLILEGFQAGLSWETILKKRENFRKAFSRFDPLKIVIYDDMKVQKLLLNPGIIRNRRKIEATIQNARAFLEIQREQGSFGAYIWQFVGGKPKQNSWKSLRDIPAQTQESETMSKHLLKRGFKFVGPTICYAYMQAVGMVNDHIVSCFRYREISRLNKSIPET
jgi:DNA-3-methyladenine glycosylase I